MKNNEEKMRMLVCLGVLIIGIVLISGCVQEKAPTNTQQQESNPLVGTWKKSVTNANGDTYEISWQFNKDYTGFVDTGESFFTVNGQTGKTFFKYTLITNIFPSRIKVYDWTPCKKTKMLYSCEPSVMEYKFYDGNKLILNNDWVLEKSWW